MTPVDRSGTAAPGNPQGTWTPSLTPRQEQILSLISAGMTNREIGAELGVAEKTVKNCVTGLLASLGLQRRSQAAVYGAMRKATTAH
jgi:DNA-binding NarL/FixJ family response regulator